jgi:hypothetical protein
MLTASDQAASEMPDCDAEVDSFLPSGNAIGYANGSAGILGGDLMIGGG